MSHLHKSLETVCVSWLRMVTAHSCLQQVGTCIDAVCYALRIPNSEKAANSAAIDKLDVTVSWALEKYRSELYALLNMIPEGEFELADMLRAEAAVTAISPYFRTPRMQYIRTHVLGEGQHKPLPGDLWVAERDFVQAASDWIDVHHPGYSLSPEQRDILGLPKKE